MTRLLTLGETLFVQNELVEGLGKILVQSSRLFSCSHPIKNVMHFFDMFHYLPSMDDDVNSETCEENV